TLPAIADRVWSASDTALHVAPVRYSRRACTPASEFRQDNVTAPPAMVVPVGGVKMKSAAFQAGIATFGAAVAVPPPGVRQRLPPAPPPHAAKPAPAAARRTDWSALGYERSTV